jgi:hypothetical protein
MIGNQSGYSDLRLGLTDFLFVVTVLRAFVEEVEFLVVLKISPLVHAFLATSLCIQKFSIPFSGSDSDF